MDPLGNEMRKGNGISLVAQRLGLSPQSRGLRLNPWSGY